MYKLSEMFGQMGGSDAFGWRAVKNIGIRTDIGQTFAETGTTSILSLLRHPQILSEYLVSGISKEPCECLHFTIVVGKTDEPSTCCIQSV